MPWIERVAAQRGDDEQARNGDGNKREDTPPALQRCSHEPERDGSGGERHAHLHRMPESCERGARRRSDRDRGTERHEIAGAREERGRSAPVASFDSYTVLRGELCRSQRRLPDKPAKNRPTLTHEAPVKEDL